VVFPYTSPALYKYTYGFYIIAPAIKCPNIVISEKAGIQAFTGCPRIAMRDRLLKSGMTELIYFVARLLTFKFNPHWHRKDGKR